MILLRHRQRREVQPPIVMLCDISGSMSPYTRMLLHFFHALGRQRRVSTFLFGTRLTNVTRQLRHRDVDEALAACSDAVADWSGGTRIASAWRISTATGRAGCSGRGRSSSSSPTGSSATGSPTCPREMDRLHRSCRRLIWLNPLLGFDGFEAKARGIRAMLPHVDETQDGPFARGGEDICPALSGKARWPRSPPWLRAA